MCAWFNRVKNKIFVILVNLIDIRLLVESEVCMSTYWLTCVLAYFSNRITCNLRHELLVLSLSLFYQQLKTIRLVHVNQCCYRIRRPLGWTTTTSVWSTSALKELRFNSISRWHANAARYVNMIKSNEPVLHVLLFSLRTSLALPYECAKARF